MILLLFVLGAVALVVITVVLTRLVARKRDSKRRSDIAVIAKTGETNAEGLLESLGYRIVSKQSHRRSYVLIDGVRMDFSVYPDFLAERGGKLFVVDVKTGKQTQKLHGAGIRRQLIEYCLIFGTPNALIVNGDTSVVSLIEFTSHFEGADAILKQSSPLPL